MSLRVIAPGPLATVQDRGRFGYRDRGVPTAGPFDRTSAAIANAMLGNAPGLAVVEMTCFGGIYEAEGTLALAIAGAPMQTRVEPEHGMSYRLAVPGVTTLRPGDRLHVGGAGSGHRAYLAVTGGWRTPVILASRSREIPLVAGERLPAVVSESPRRRTSLGRLEAASEPIRYLDGPDTDLMAPDALESGPYRVSSESDRMGIRLDGGRIEISTGPDRLSTPVAPGTIQIAGGLPLVLGPASGTMGGYPHVGQVISADLDRLGQFRSGSDLRFRRVSLVEARRLDRQAREELRRLVLILQTTSRLT